jgi:hypothetical protein
VAAKRAEIVGNRVMLLGAVVYLLEWVAIIPAGDTGPVDPDTRSPRAVFDLYAAHPVTIGPWFLPGEPVLISWGAHSQS